MRWKITNVSPTHGGKYNYSLGYPTKASAQAAAKRLQVTAQWPPNNFKVEKMTAEDEATMRRLEATQ